MGLGGSIFLLVLGAILAFAVRLEPEWIDLETTGWIFMIAGIVGIVLTSWYAKRKRRLHQEVHETYQNNRLARREAVRRADAVAAEGRRREEGDAD
ncbi:LPXTG-motif cell wall-anchored protein [Stackebrandtia albiflava]|uniref:LPXTG-motif cell wall-anchored protein n=2 Tax=Stackebrandtia albiflava TaxID=406432 RepID=A0A562V178_9ACTN|nr:LPXTG-motif cell wall-anchored protein [Stackebrandtia albiflava]